MNSQSRYFLRLSAILDMILFVGDLITGLLIGYDLWKRCHILLSIEAFIICALPGFIEGLRDLGWDIHFRRLSFIRLSKEILNPIWFLPGTILKYKENIIHLSFDTKFAAQE